jgi:hypothetical protein
MIEVLMPPHRLLPLLSETTGGRFVFQGFEQDAAGVGFAVAAPDADLAAAYARGGYHVAYISLRGFPRGPRDFDFTDREQDWLIEVRGGRMRGSKLEIATLRLMSKRSRIKARFIAIGRQLRRLCAAGVTIDGDPRFTKVLWDPGVHKLALWVNLDGHGRIRVAGAPRAGARARRRGLAGARGTG